MTLMTAPLINIFETGDYDAAVAQAADQLRAEGGVVVLPTETVYGAAAVLTHDKAVQRLKAIRGAAADDKPFTIHLARREQATRYLGEISETGRRLMQKLWPGPVSLAFDVPAERRAEVAKQTGLAESDLYSA